ncbi:MAG: DinB family protein [Chloroflexi bacterium]|nr:DinB family protein [Chloroflexota bacterium]
MKWQKLMADSFDQVQAEAERVLNGLTRDDLLKQPHPDSNSIGWLVWHLTRVQDSSVAQFMGEEQLWVKDGWHAKFNRKPDPKDTGSGHTSRQVAAFRAPNTKTLEEYLRAVSERTRKYIGGLSATDLDKKVEGTPFQPPPSVGVYMVMILSDNLQHVGQAGYARGLLKGKGWQPF